MKDFIQVMMAPILCLFALGFGVSAAVRTIPAGPTMSQSQFDAFLRAEHLQAQPSVSAPVTPTPPQPQTPCSANEIGEPGREPKHATKKPSRGHRAKSVPTREWI